MKNLKNMVTIVTLSIIVTAAFMSGCSKNNVAETEKTVKAETLGKSKDISEITEASSLSKDAANVGAVAKWAKDELNDANPENAEAVR